MRRACYTAEHHFPEAVASEKGIAIASEKGIAMLSLRATALAAAVAGFCASPLLSQGQRPAAFQLADVSCTKVDTGPTKYPDPTWAADVPKFDRVFGEGATPIGLVGRRDSNSWTRLPRFWATLTVWPGDGRQPVNNTASYMLRAPDPKTGERYHNLNAVAINVFSLDNPEVLLKVFVGAPYGHGLQAWVYAAAATDLPMELRIWDVDTRRLATWRKRPGPAVALTDTTTMLGTDCSSCGQDPYCAAIPGGSWRGLQVEEEERCSVYDADDYPYPQSVEHDIVRGLGTVVSPYTCETFASTTDTDIEHIVARSEAHDSGLCAADPETRARFGRDLMNLTLASPALNRYEKSDRDAASWLPERNRCWFAQTVVNVRRAYGLTIDPDEALALESVLSSCSSETIQCP